ncbi:MAG: SprT family zinc-dependent metalloprotease [Candidatus Latescibacteria bacterium]|nr:SprT family zinc-dependent metalloprotease [Candidatus Latescibacterota bacterium]
MKEQTAVAVICDKPVRYRVRRSDRARRLSLQVSPRKGLEVVLPRRWSLAELDRALHENAAWIDAQVERFDVRLGPKSPELSTGSLVLVLGRPRELKVEGVEPGRRRGRVVAENDRLRVQLTPDDRLDPRPLLERWLRRLAHLHIEARVRELAALHGLTPSRVIIGERTSRWGSCSHKGNLSFCYRLVMAPPAVIDAVVCHELCHLRHLNHGPGFRKLLAEVCPHHDESMSWLRDQHDDLQI